MAHVDIVMAHVDRVMAHVDSNHISAVMDIYKYYRKDITVKILQ